MNTRLTIDKRTSILRDEIRVKFHDKKSSLNKLYLVEAEKQIIKTIPKYITPDVVSNGWVSNKCSFFSSTTRDMSYIPKKIDTFYPVMKNNYYGHEIQLTKKMEAMVKKMTQLNKDISGFRAELNSVLQSYTSSKKLIEAIPELAVHFKDSITSQALVPVEKIKSVRKSLAKREKNQ